LAIQGFDPNLLLGFFQAKLSAGVSAAAPNATSARPSVTAKDIPPWQRKQLAHLLRKLLGALERDAAEP